MLFLIGYGANGNIKPVEKLIQEIITKKVTVDTILYNTVLDSYIR